MKITQLDIPAHQMNTKFVNNLPFYWAKYVNNVKNNKDISTPTYVELYTYLKSYEPHALKTLKKQEQSSSIVASLAYLASKTYHFMPTQPTNPLPSTSSLTLPPQPAAQSSNDAMLETMNQILRTSSNSRSHAMVHDGHIVTKTIQRKALSNVVSHEDAYDSDVDKGPHAVEAFIANLSSTSGTNGATTSHVNEVHTNNKQIFDNMNHMLAHEIHQEEHLDSNVESDIDDNTIPYHQYQLDSEVLDVPTEVSSVSPDEISMITILDDLRNQLDGHLMVNQEQSMVNDSLRAELTRCKLKIQTLKRNKVKHDLDTTIVQRNKRNAELEQENVLLMSKLSQKVESINSLKTESKKVLSEKRTLRKALGSSNSWHTKQAKIAQPTLYYGHALLKPTNTPVRVHDSEESLVQAEVSRPKMSNRPGIIKPINYTKLNALYSHFVPKKELSQEQVY
nr:hypothetical protein [Tanacetum cinerariifolium]